MYHRYVEVKFYVQVLSDVTLLNGLPIEDTRVSKKM